MTKLDKLIQLQEETVRLLSIFVGPIVSLKSEQVAKMSDEDRKVISKTTLQRAREKYGKRGKRI
jgi:hypothetical protein